MEKIEFKIKFLTPLLIHGAESRDADSIGLTGKALRGCLRFWFRALVGGMVKNISKEKLLELEGNIFGSSDEEIGSKFKMVITPIGNPIPKNDIHPGFKADFKFSGFPEGSEFLISILPRKNMDKEEIKILVATIWLWGNLGGIGQRARRGFGSPMIVVDSDINPFRTYFDDKEFPVYRVCDNIVNLENHLKEGLIMGWKTFKEWSKIKALTLNPDIWSSAAELPTNSPYFILRSFKQIAVGSTKFLDLNSGLNKIHGNNNCKSLGWARGGRMASPIITRFHKIKDKDNESFLPIITWCPQQIKTQKIPHQKCLKAYLMGGICDCNQSFAPLNFSKYLSKDPI